ncbi:GntR family transcriptional regulator [Pseudooceanicola spongiae]|uniref:UTRA domain-containing protein n=1 Tax=Pseudooceanicola spongiae TaxID=2613965 RepID=A0A7L9WRP6_9RHOB|nr:GntR family transcriptional regulator [Pseudooceanicola spongiae]QOL82116.1 UTRA domain-containing protein [Pseudooceanicola spongiae]
MTTPQRHSWKDIRDRIHARILDRTYRPGDKLPHDEDMAQTLGCSRSTVQRAMQDLSESGLVERRRKGGTHVRPEPVARVTIEIPIIRKEVEDLGQRHGYQLLSRAALPPPAEIATRMELSAHVPCLHVRALHLAQDRPYLYEDRWINLQTAAEIDSVDLCTISANEWLVLNMPYTRCELRFFALAADADLAKALHTSPNTALFAIERTTWIDTQPITTVRTIGAPGYQLSAST